MRQRMHDGFIPRLALLLVGLTATASLSGCKKAINDGTVGSSCQTQSECGPGLVCDCVSSTCQPADQGNPYCANQDAKVREAGPVDAARDADLDAAPLQDAQSTDAATPDATMDDGGTSDASVQDLDASLDAKVDAS